jgi:hypothetical protein
MSSTIRVNPGALETCIADMGTLAGGRGVREEAQGLINDNDSGDSKGALWDVCKTISGQALRISVEMTLLCTRTRQLLDNTNGAYVVADENAAASVQAVGS